MKRSALGVALVAVLTCAGCASDGEAPPKQQGAALDLPTSDWEAGDEMMFGQITGVLRLDDRGCLTLDGTAPPVWPKGYTAYRHDGEVTLCGPKGEVVATDGDTIESGGGEVPVGNDDSVTPSECLSPTGDLLLVQGQVEVMPD